MVLALLTPTVAIRVQLKSILCQPDWVKLSFVIFDIRALWAQDWASECPDVQKLQMFYKQDAV